MKTKRPAFEVHGNKKAAGSSMATDSLTNQVS
jgi:hypothetical protein